MEVRTCITYCMFTYLYVLYGECVPGLQIPSLNHAKYMSVSGLNVHNHGSKDAYNQGGGQGGQLPHWNFQFLWFFKINYPPN